MSNQFFAEPDGLSGPELWRSTDRPDAATVELVLRKADLPGPYDELLWRVVTGVLAPDEATLLRIDKTIDHINMAAPSGDPYWHVMRQVTRAVLAALADPAGGAA